MERVELHCHTKYSPCDGLIEIEDLILHVASQGMKGIAITDYGTTDGFPEAYKILSSLKQQKKIPEDFKIIYGAEVYLADDLKGAVDLTSDKSINDSVVVISIATTGDSPIHCQIFEIVALRMTSGKIIDRFSYIIDPEEEPLFPITDFSWITNDMAKNSKRISEVLPALFNFIGDSAIVVHNSDVVCGFLKKETKRFGLTFNHPTIDVKELCRWLLPNISPNFLHRIAKEINLRVENRYETLYECELLAQIYSHLVKLLNSKGITKLSEINPMLKGNIDYINNLPTYHATILVTEQIGIENLYHITTLAQNHYFQRLPRVPKSILSQYRDGLIIGTACEMGEIMKHLMQYGTDPLLIKKVLFYDFLEVQPTSNHRITMSFNQYHLKNENDFKNLNLQLVSLGEALNLPVIATTDTHYLLPSDWPKRESLLIRHGCAPIMDEELYLKSSTQMLEEFSYLGVKKANEIVIENPNKIWAAIDILEP